MPSFKLHTWTFLLILIANQMIKIRADESIEENRPNCDSALNFIVDDEDKMIKDYIIHFDLRGEYRTSNESNEMCFDFLKKVLSQIELYKSESKEKYIKKRDDELQFEIFD